MEKIWIKGNKFSELNTDQFDGLSVEEKKEYHKALSKFRNEESEALAAKILELSKSKEENKEEIDKLKEQLNGVDLKTVKEMLSALKTQGAELAKLKEAGTINDGTFKSALKSAFDKNSNKLKSLEKGDSFDLVVKASQTYGDITSGSDFAQMRPGIVDIPVRRPRIRELFGTIPVSTEYLKYTEQDTVIRDAQNVAKCSPVVSTTKETLIVRSIETQIIKDMIEFCRHFVSDYPFMESRINRLINQSLALRIDDQLLNGTGVAPQIFSIESVSSEFSAANPVCVATAAIKDAYLVDLLLTMETQITELGQQEDYVVDTFLVNKCDWFLQVQSKKDANNNYMDTRVSVVNGVPTLNGVRVIWSPLVPQNKCYAFDSTKGEIVDRQELVLEVSFENKDNWESEIATLKGYERLNFLVPNNWANAFMKCSDVATAVAAIKAP